MHHSRVGDGICDCCDGSDEAESECPNTCRNFYQRALDKSVQKLQTALTGHKQRLNAETEAKELMKIMKGKYDTLLQDQADIYDLANFVTFYKQSEGRFKNSNLPRMDYKLQASRLKAVKEGRTNVDRAAADFSSEDEQLGSQLKTILGTKCPTADFTLEHFFATYSAPLKDPRRRDKFTSRKPTDTTKTLIDPLLDDPAGLGLGIVGLTLFGPVQLAGWAAKAAKELLFFGADEEAGAEGVLGRPLPRR